MPFMGNTTNSATMLGSKAPQIAPRSQRLPPTCLRTSAHNSTPHSPPQKASEITEGTPSGGTAVMFQAGFGTAPARCSNSSRP